MKKLIVLLCLVLPGCSGGVMFGLRTPISHTKIEQEIRLTPPCDRVEADPNFIVGYTEAGVAILRPERVLHLKDNGQALPVQKLPGREL